MATASKSTTRKSSGSRKSSNGRSSSSKSSRSNGSASASSRSSTKRSGSTASRNSGSSTKRSGSTRSSNGRSSTKRSTTSSSSRSRNGGASKNRLTELASKARMPLIAGGTAVASAAAGFAARKYAESRTSTMGRLRRRLPSISPSKLSPSKLSLGKMKAAGERMAAIGQQTVDVANAVEKTRKKHK